MTRFDLYGTVHKGLRALLFDVTQQVARTDFERADEAAAAAEAVERLLGFLHEHAEHEDREILPELAQRCPELATDLETDHARTRRLEDDLGQFAARVGRASGVERTSLGRKLHQLMGGLVAEHLRHMEREEVQANRVLWANLGDDELAGIHARVLAAIAPARLAEWIEILLPAVNGPEREMLRAKAGAALPC